MLYKFSEIFRRNRIINRRLYETLEDLYDKVGSGSGGDSLNVQIVEVAAAGSELTKTEVKTAFGTTTKPFCGIVTDTTNNKTYFTVFNGSKVDLVLLKSA